MLNTVFVNFDKLRKNEKLIWKDVDFNNEFAHLLFDFIYADVKQRYYNIIDDATKGNHKEVYDKIYNLFNQDDTLLCKIFFYDYDRFVQESKLCDYSATYRKFDTKTKSYIDLHNETPFNSERDKKIRKLLDIIELKQQTYSFILDFCAVTSKTDDEKTYTKHKNKFMYACKRLLGHIEKPKITFNTTYTPLSKITLNKLEKDYKEHIASKYDDFQEETNPFDDFYYVCYDIDDYFVTVMLQVFEKGYIIPKCENCGKYFVPIKNSSAKYCNKKSPQNPNKTCKEFASPKPKGLNSLHRKIYQKKFNRATRNPSQNAEFETWKEMAKEIKAKYNKGEIKDNEYYNWLIKNGD